MRSLGGGGKGFGWGLWDIYYTLEFRWVMGNRWLRKRLEAG